MREAAGPPRGIIQTGQRPQAHGRHLPCAALRPFVEHFWSVSWDMGGAAPQRVQTLPHPSVHMVFETGRPAEIGGVHRGRFSRMLAGQGRVFGIKFRPGGFFPFVQWPMHWLTDRTLPIDAIFGCPGAELAATIQARSTDEQRMLAAEAFLCARLPAADPNVALVERLVDHIVGQPAATRVDELCEQAGLGKRALQQLFRNYIGIGPKWMIQRYRLHEALERLEQSTSVDWAEFALALGYFDQAHFNKDFRLMVGMTPGEYRTINQAPRAG
jgi:AraC-like DNA-binding protein